MACTLKNPFCFFILTLTVTIEYTQYILKIHHVKLFFKIYLFLFSYFLIFKI